MTGSREVVYNNEDISLIVIMDYDRIRGILEQLYGRPAATPILGDLSRILDGYRSRLQSRPGGLSQRDSILLTYPDQIREPGTPPLRSLAAFCRDHLSGVVSGIHILPFYPWTSDDGFSVVDYKRVLPDYGGWEDIHSLGTGFRLMFDAVINHVSIQSRWFREMLRGEPRYQDYFISPPSAADLSGVVRPRALPLLTEFTTATGDRLIWTTFSADQADLNYQNPSVLLEIVDVLLFYVLQGAAFIRLDAIAYLWKEPGTGCINLPQTHAIIKLFRLILDDLAPGVSLITETNVPHADNISYFGDGTNEARMVYNFSLPPLVLHAFQTGSAERLSEWASTLALPSKEVTFFNFLASHDGIGLNPLRGIVSEEEISQMVQRVRAHGGLISLKSGPDGSPHPYELNINYFDALNDPQSDEGLEIQLDRIMTAHAILLAMQGVPGIYFHSIFGSRGWPEGVAETGRNRTINRQKFTRAELEATLSSGSTRQAKVFERMAQLLKARAELRAFHPYAAQAVLSVAPGVFGLLRTAPEGGEHVVCLHNVSGEYQHLDMEVLAPISKPSQTWHDVISGHSVIMNDNFSLDPYESVWLI